jgi:hypothetical protein
MVRSSRLAHDGSTLLPGVVGPGVSRAPLWGVLTAAMWARTAAVSSGPGARSARGNAERRSARSRHSGAWCSQAPRPGSRRRGSGTSTPASTTTLNRPSACARLRHPTQVRTGPAGDRRSTAEVGPAVADPELWAGTECSAARAPAPSSWRAVRLSRPTPSRTRRGPRGGPRRCGCRCASRSAGPPTGRSGPPCRWRARAGSPAPRPGRSSCGRREP